MNRNTTAHKMLTAVIMPALLLTSLPSCTAILEDPALASLAGAGLGAGLGAALDSNNRGRGALVGGAAGGMAGYLVAKHYQASQEQIRLAEQRAAAAARSSATKKRLEQSRTRYVAVPVKPSGQDQNKSGAKNLVMVYDTQSGELVNEKAHVPSKSAYSTGEVATFGGKKTIVSTGFSGI